MALAGGKNQSIGGKSIHRRQNESSGGNINWHKIGSLIVIFTGPGPVNSGTTDISSLTVKSIGKQFIEVIANKYFRLNFFE